MKKRVTQSSWRRAFFWLVRIEYSCTPKPLDLDVMYESPRLSMPKSSFNHNCCNWSALESSYDIPPVPAAWAGKKRGKKQQRYDKKLVEAARVQ